VTRQLPSIAKKILAAGGLALGLSCIGLLASAGTAAARQESCSPGPCTGTYQTDASYPAGSSGYGTRDTASYPGVASIDGFSR
jgi:hypothetical protein